MSKRPTSRPPSTQIQPKSSDQDNDSGSLWNCLLSLRDFLKRPRRRSSKRSISKVHSPHHRCCVNMKSGFRVLGERILAMTEKEQTHRHDWDRQMLEYQGKEVQNGQKYGFGLGAFALCGGVLCAYIGQPWVAGILVGTTPLGIVAAFIQGRLDK